MGHKLYNTARWARLRLATLAMDGNRCRMCRVSLDLKGKSKPTSAEIDHIVPHKGCPQLFHDPSNLQSLCKGCHGTTKQRMERGTSERMVRPDGWSPGR